jgi:hypothetical protein
MNREAALITTLEKLNERIARLEHEYKYVNSRANSTFIRYGGGYDTDGSSDGHPRAARTGVPVEDFADDIIEISGEWFNFEKLEPSDIHQAYMLRGGMDNPDVHQLKHLERVIAARKGEFGAKLLLDTIVKKMEQTSVYLRYERFAGIKTAVTVAYGINSSGPARDGRPAHGARGRH